MRYSFILECLTLNLVEQGCKDLYLCNSTLQDGYAANAPMVAAMAIMPISSHPLKKSDSTKYYPLGYIYKSPSISFNIRRNHRLRVGPMVAAVAAVVGYKVAVLRAEA